MVFYITPKRTMRPRTPDQGASITDLPDELLLKVLNDVETSDIFNLKSTCSILVPACNTVIQANRNVLYIHPNRKHLGRVPEICAHHVFSQGIEEVIILDKILWRQMELNPPSKKESYRYRHWPSQYPTPTEELRDTAAARVSSPERPSLFKAAYEPLLTALTKLPNLKRLGFAEAVSKPGFNQISKAAIDAYAQKCTEPASKETAALLKSGNFWQHNRCWTDTDAFYAILLDSGIRFESLTLDTELPFIKNTVIDIQSPLTSPRGLELGSALAAMREVNLTFTCGWPINSHHLLHNHILYFCSATLERLRIAFVPNAAVKKASIDRALDVVIGRKTFPRLQSLEIELLDPPALVVSHPIVRSSARPGNLGRSQRPLCLDYDFCGFLSRHIANLESLRFRNVIFITEQHGIIRGVTAVIRDTLSLLKTEESKLKSLEWRVSNYKHDPRCKRKDDEHFVACKFQCEIYVAIPWSMYVEGRWSLERLAIKLSIEQGDGVKVWDFGRAFRERSRIPSDVELET